MEYENGTDIAEEGVSGKTLATGRRGDLIGAVSLLCVLVGALPAHAEKRVALVVETRPIVGSAQLANPVNDARAIAAKLKIIGFDAILRENTGNWKWSVPSLCSVRN
jgi:hypothetical protein